MLRKLLYMVVLTASLIVPAACSDGASVTVSMNAPAVSDDGVNRPLVNLFETATATGTFTTLVSALQASGLDAELANEANTFTVFAPTDAAFDKLGEDAINQWYANPEDMKDALQYHIVPGKAINSDEAVAIVGSLLAMSNGDDVSVTHDGSNFYINNAEVIVMDVKASNGVIHVIDTVLSPPVIEPSALNIVETIVEKNTYNILNDALVATGVADTLSNTDRTFTLLAPTDEAFSKLPDGRLESLMADTDLLKNMLLYHVIEDEAVDATTAMSLSGQTKNMANGAEVAMYLIQGQLKFNSAAVTSTDLSASNGIIHTLDSVLMPTAHLVSSPDHQQVAVGSIYDVALSTPDFSLFAAALQSAGLDSALGCPVDMYTVFLPTNEAFKSLGQETQSRLSSNPAAMREVLLQHMLPGRILDTVSATERLGYSLNAGNGGNLVVTQKADTLWVNDAKLVTTDITTVNGVIHVIDKVLMPK